MTRPFIPDRESGGIPTGGTGGFGGSGTFEQCDDGNSTANDGCDASCVIESGFACPEPAAPCHRIVCGDGIADWPNEECDDGNQTPNDGCTDCTLDSGSGGTGGTAGVGGSSGGPSTGGVGGG